MYKIYVSPKGSFLAEFELYLLLAIERAGGESYGAAIRREIQTRTGRPVSIGAVYATLGRLEDKKLVTHAVSEPTPVPGGRARKYFSLTAAGRRALEHSTRMLMRMIDGTGLLPN
jgi:DNA-binding PadR family transcriptional regulator